MFDVPMDFYLMFLTLMICLQPFSNWTMPERFSDKINTFFAG